MQKEQIKVDPKKKAHSKWKIWHKLTEIIPNMLAIKVNVN